LPNKAKNDHKALSIWWNHLKFWLFKDILHRS
jgi:hypothetical protein